MKSKKPTSGKSKEKVLVANTILLKDRQGKPRVYIEASDVLDNSRITILGKNGESLCLLVDGDSTISVELHRRDGRVAAAIGMCPEGEAQLVLSDVHGAPVIVTQADLGKRPRRGSRQFRAR